MRSLILYAATAAMLAVGPALADDPPAKPRTFTVTVGQTVRLQMSTKRPIKSVFNDHEKVVHVQAVLDDPTTVLVTGLMPGRARLTMTDIDGHKEARDLGKPSGK